MTRGRAVYLSTDEQQIIAHSLGVALAGEWNDGDFTFEDEEEAERMLAAARSAIAKIGKETP
jgi:hypothetical protein